MPQNKIVNAAILAALAERSGIAQAGTFVMTDPVTTTPSVAIELFEEEDDPSILPMSSNFVVRYTVAQNINTDFYVTYTLSMGQWEEDSNGLLQLSSENLTVSNVTTVSIVQLENQTVKYLVQAGANALNQNGVLDFRFKIGGLEELANEGTKVRLDVALEVAAAPDTQVDTAGAVTLLQSAAGAIMTFDAGTTTTQIDVAEGATKFTNGISDTAASLGTLEMTSSTPRALKFDLDTMWAFHDTCLGAMGGKLKIEQGPFAASLSHDPMATPDPVNLVFIDVTGPKCVFDINDVPADEVTEESASWNLDITELSRICTMNTKRDICVLVPTDNSTAINETQDAPEALLTIDYSARSIQYKGRLLHIKRNGTVCTLYNVPAEGTVDLVNIRVINRSSREGTLMGSLRDADNVYIFQNVDLLNGEKLAPNATVRLTATELKAVAMANGHATGTWSGRAVLTITSDLTEMEVFGLLRNSAGGPLLNISTGASGSGCD